MTLELRPLDDLRFQDLVAQARKTIAKRCPQWTEHNVSDPGITLIEQFASMTEMLGYRIDRIPQQLHVELLRLLDIKLEPPAAATAELEFRLAAPAAGEVTIPAHDTEVTTTPGAGEEPIVFQVAEKIVIRPLRLQAVVVQRGGREDSLAVSEGECRPTGPDGIVFGAHSARDDGLYLGFAKPLDRLLLRISVDASKAGGAGIDPSDPPLCWEAWARASDAAAEPEMARWTEARVLGGSDTTKGFNDGGGEIELRMPAATATKPIAGERLHWLRCRLADDGQPDRQYRRPPQIDRITAHVVGAMVPAEHAIRVTNEELGVSDGTPAQSFQIRQAPALELSADEQLEVRKQGSAKWVPWTAVESFADSKADDPHFRFDPATGRIHLGPGMLEHAGTAGRRPVRPVPGQRWVQRGAIPPAGATLRMAAYHHGGGARGNVAEGTLRVLRRGIPGVASVSNEKPARGGVDAEKVDDGRRRAEKELRTQYRAVTADDYEFLAEEASPRVKRARCSRQLTPGHAIPVYVLPTVPDPFEPPRALDLKELTPEPGVLEKVSEYLEKRRVLGTSVDVQAVRLRGVQIAVEVETLADPKRVEDQIRQRLYRYVNPFGGSLQDDPEGWDFGRSVTEADLRAVVQKARGVKDIRLLRVYECYPASREEQPRPAGAVMVIGPDELVCSGTHAVRCRRV